MAFRAGLIFLVPASCSVMQVERTLIAAQGYIELDMTAEALRELDTLPKEEQARLEVMQVRLFIFMRSRSWKDAMAVCKRLRESDPQQTTGYIHGAFCLHEMGQTREAKDLLLSGPTSLLREATYYYNLGCYDAVLGNVADAQHALEISFKMDDKFREIAKYDPDLKGVLENS
jgi:predicted Zn-dependent protease